MKTSVAQQYGGQDIEVKFASEARRGSITRIRYSRHGKEVGVGAKN